MTDWTGLDYFNAADIPYDPTTSGLSATDVQAAIDETVALIPATTDDLPGLVKATTNHATSPTNADRMPWAVWWMEQAMFRSRTRRHAKARRLFIQHGRRHRWQLYQRQYPTVDAKDASRRQPTDQAVAVFGHW